MHIEGEFHNPQLLGRSNYLEDFVYGGIDGAVTTFAVVAGVQGAALAPAIVVVLGLANLFADGLSMAIGNFLSLKARRERYHNIRDLEIWEIENLPQKEIDEIRTIYKAKGFEGDLLEKVVSKIISDKKLWLDTMMFEEIGLTPETKKPLRAGMTTFISFNLIGSISLIPYIGCLAFNIPQSISFTMAIVMTGVALGSVGFVKAKIVEVSKFRSAIETMFIGGLAAAVAYSVGFILRSLVS